MLVLRALGLGDLLTALPALRAIRAAFTRHRVVLATPRSLSEIVSLAGVADEVMDHRGLSPLSWNADPPELAVNLHGKGPQSHLLLRSTAPSRMVGFGSREADHQGPAWIAHEHEITRWCRLVSQSLDVAADPQDLRLPRPAGVGLAGASGATAILHPGAASRSRRWPPERWAVIARRLTDRGLRVMVTGNADEVALAEEVVRSAGLSCGQNVAGQLGLLELARAVTDAGVLVCGDTGVAHLATAMGTPSVLLFGPVSPRLWGPPPGGVHRVLWHGDGSGDPHGDRPDPALLRITTDEVLASLDELLSERRPELLGEPVQRSC